MTIKPEKYCYIYLGLLIACILGCDSFFLYTLKKSGIWYTVVLTVMASVIGIPYSIVTCRTLCFDSHGCTISFLGIRKFTSWSQLVIRQEENFNNSITYPGTFAKKPDAGAVFSTKKKERPWWMGPVEYCALRNPFTTFFVVYREENLTAKIRSSHIVERQIFLAMLTSYGIVLKSVKKKGWLG